MPEMANFATTFDTVVLIRNFLSVRWHCLQYDARWLILIIFFLYVPVFQQVLPDDIVGWLFVLYSDPLSQNDPQVQTSSFFWKGFWGDIRIIDLVVLTVTLWAWRTCLWSVTAIVQSLEIPLVKHFHVNVGGIVLPKYVLFYSRWYFSFYLYFQNIS